MDAQQARVRWQALLRMTVERGCTIHEAATAKRMADVLAKKFSFVHADTETKWRPDFDARYERAERKAAMRYVWEYRTCGKVRCRCMRGGRPHGPYKYGKRRVNGTPHSIYIGL